jgi:uncharacterized protein Veg
MAKRWTQAEKEFLLNNFDKMANAKMAAALGRSIHAVRKQCARMGLKREQKETSIKDYIEYQPGDLVRVTFDTWNRYKCKERTGRVLKVYDKYVLVQFEGWRECVNLGSLITGDTRMELLKRGKAA